MRIGIDIRALMEGKTTGVEVYIINLLHTLFRLDKETEYVLFATSFRDVSGKLRKFDYPNVRYKIFPWPNKIFNFLQFFFRYPKIDEILGGLDLFFSPHYRVIAFSKKCPSVITFHDLSFEIFPEFFTLWKRMWHRFMNYAGAARRARKIIAVSEHTKNDLVSLYGIAPEKIRVIHSGVNPPAVPQAEIERNLPERFFLAFGTFEPRKNLDAVLSAYIEYYGKSRSKIPLVLAGAEGWKVNFKKLSGKTRNFIHILKNATEGEKEYLYHHAFALLSLSFYEGFGFPMLEAASAGVPVIASAATSLGEIGHDFALLVNPFRSAQIAAGMINLENDDKLYQDMKKRGLEASKKYNWRKTAEETLELFRKLCA